MTAFAGRVQDWLDIEGTVVWQRAALDRSLVRDELLPLLELKEDDTTEDRLLRMFTKHPA